MTDLGAHFNDLAQWAHGSEYAGPMEYEGWGSFPEDGLFNTPVNFEVTATYPDGVKMVIHDESESGRGPRGNKFVGSEGWVSVDDTGKITDDPIAVWSDDLRAPIQSLSTENGAAYVLARDSLLKVGLN